MARPRSAKKASRPRKVAAKTCEKEAFVEGLLIRGEAVPEPPPGEDLPPGATHTFTRGSSRNGDVPRAGTLRRRRFSVR